MSALVGALAAPVRLLAVVGPERERSWAVVFDLDGVLVESEGAWDAARRVAIEDSSNGLRSAAAAGMHVLAVPNREFPPDADALALAEVVLPSLESLTPATICAIERCEA